MSIFLLSPHSIEKSSDHSSKAAPRPVDLHCLRVFEQTDRGGELCVLHRGGEAGERLRVCDVGRHFENFAGEMIDAVDQAAATGDKNAGADVIDERFFFESAFE